MALINLVNDPYSAKRYLAEIGAYDISGQQPRQCALAIMVW